ncbi:Transposase [Ceratobasidium sp. AG-Ba]|nr:Transposase [Ceratobasidium sp. AG-Ba]
MTRSLNQSTIDSVLTLLDSGHSYAQIKARIPEISKSSIGNICSKYRPELDKPVGGRPRKLNPYATRYAVRLVTNNNSVSTRQATQTLCGLTGQSIHPKTVKRALKRAGLVPVKKPQKPKLLQRHANERLAFAEAHQHWTVDDWKRVLWSDETKINRLGSDGVHWAWKRRGEGLNPQMIVPTANFGGGSLMFWGCMGWNGTGFGCKLERTLTKEMYMEILGDEFSRSLEYLGMEPGEVIFQQDNASSHKAKICLQWFDDHGIELLEWPALSPDLNPIENLWAELKRRLGEYEEPPNGILELWDRVQDVWNSFGEEYCQNLIKSMPERIALVLEARGRSISY